MKLTAMTLSFALIAIVHVAHILAANVLRDSHGLEYASLNAQRNNLPLLVLPYGTWQASKYDVDSDVYTFRNIRFAAPPVGDLRFAKPIPPIFNGSLQNGDHGGTCYLTVAVIGPIGFVNQTRPNGGNILNPWISNMLVDYNLLPTMGGFPFSEDCLFLDMIVPGKALRKESKLPVINFIYGGAYVAGLKDVIFDGMPLVEQSHGNVIYVIGNYRHGALGFLGGTTVEKEADPNVGIWDQRAVLEWIKKYIHLVNGDADDVTVWGQSAGAGSVMHHLVAFGGKSPRLFKKAIMQSPGYVPQIDRRGMIEQQFKDFAALLGCAGRGITCLRSKDIEQIRAATSTTVSGAPTGMFGFGPVPDGVLIRQLPDLELASGNFQKDVESIIITHVSDEGASFIPPGINSTAISTLLSLIFSTEDVRKSILDHYPPVGLLKSGGTFAKFKSEGERFKTFLESHAFNCHIRAVANAYEGRAKVYLGQYSRGDGQHASDLPATFHNSTASNSLSRLMEWSDPGFGNFARSYRDYFLSFARTGDPNKLKSPNSIDWPTFVGESVFQNVLDAGSKGFELIKDNITSAENCNFFLKAWAEATKQGGYTPLDGAVSKPKP